MKSYSTKPSSIRNAFNAVNYVPLRTGLRPRVAVAGIVRANVSTVKKVSVKDVIVSHPVQGNAYSINSSLGQSVSVSPTSSREKLVSHRVQGNAYSLNSSLGQSVALVSAGSSTDFSLEDNHSAVEKVRQEMETRHKLEVFR